jgi:hypothetical protein
MSGIFASGANSLSPWIECVPNTPALSPNLKAMSFLLDVTDETTGYPALATTLSTMVANHSTLSAVPRQPLLFLWRRIPLSE